MITLGLDISTSVVGICFLADDASVIELTHLSLPPKYSFYEKVDAAIEALGKLMEKHSPDVVYIEKPVLAYGLGMSSAATIIVLSNYNYMLSYAIRNKMSKDPIHITVGEARKLCGLHMRRKADAGGKSHKEQTFDAMVAPGGPLHNYPFPKTKNGTYKGFVADEVDSFVIARAGMLSGLQLPKASA